VFTLITGGVACGTSAHLLARGGSLALLFMKLVGLSSGAFTETGCFAILNSFGSFAAQCRRAFLHRRSGPYPTGALP
jgi:hypothetical protein